jgi:cytochrome c oxidase subunit I+III
LPPLAAALAGLCLWAAAAGAVELGARRLERRAGLPAWLLATGVLALAAFASQWAGQSQAGLAPRAEAWSASVAVLLANEGLHALVVALVAAFALARERSAALGPRQRSPLDVLRLLVHASALQALAATLVVRGLPAWLTGT